MPNYVVSICGVATSGKTTLAATIASQNKQFVHVEVDEILTLVPKNKFNEDGRTIDLYMDIFMKIFREGKIPIIDHVNITALSFANVRPVILYTPLEKLISNFRHVMIEREASINDLMTIIEQFERLYICDEGSTRTLPLGHISFTNIYNILSKHYKFYFKSEIDLNNFVSLIKVKLGADVRTDTSLIYLRSDRNSLYIVDSSINARVNSFNKHILPHIANDLKILLKTEYSQIK